MMMMEAVQLLQLLLLLVEEMTSLILTQRNVKTNIHNPKHLYII